MFKYSLTNRLLFAARDLTSRRLFGILRRYTSGEVLDVGGASFVLSALKNNLIFSKWTTLDVSETTCLEVSDERVNFLIGDGCNINAEDNSFDTVLNIQVLEHTFEPFKMFQECVRVLRPGGYAIFLIPQTGTMHLAPYHFQNFMRFWIEEAAKRTQTKIEELIPIGGWWATIASRMVYFFLTSLRRPGNSVPECKRNPVFYLLFPLMAIYALVSLPVCLFLSLGDLTEEPLNHLVVIKKPDSR